MKEGLNVVSMNYLNREIKKNYIESYTVLILKVKKEGIRMKKLSWNFLLSLLFSLLVILAPLGCAGKVDKDHEEDKSSIIENTEKNKNFEKEIKTEKVEVISNQEKVELTEEEKELQKLKVIEAKGYKIDTTKQDPYDKVEVKNYREKFMQDGKEVNGTFYEYISYSKNKKYVVVIYLKAGEGEYSRWTYFELFEGINKKELRYKKTLDKSRVVEECQVFSNGYVLLNTHDFGGNDILEIFNPKGEKIFSSDLERKYYVIPSNEKYLLVIEKNKTFKISKYDFSINNLNLIDKINYEGEIYFYSSMISKDGNYFVVKNFIDNKVKLFLYYDFKLLWEKEYTRKDLQVDEKGPYFTFSKKNKYILFGYGVIDTKTGGLIKSGMNEEEFRKYEEEK